MDEGGPELSPEGGDCRRPNEAIFPSNGGWGQAPKREKDSKRDSEMDDDDRSRDTEMGMMDRETVRCMKTGVGGNKEGTCLSMENTHTRDAVDAGAR